MAQVTEAVFKDGVLRPLNGLQLREDERVRLIIERFESPTAQERAAAFARFRERALRMGFRSTGPYPTRDELHERG